MSLNKYKFFLIFSLHLVSATCLADESSVYDDSSRDTVSPLVVLPLEGVFVLDSIKDNSIQAAMAFESWFVLYKKAFHGSSYFETILKRSNEYTNSLKDLKSQDQGKVIWERYKNLVKAYYQNPSNNIDNFVQKIKEYNDEIHKQKPDRLKVAERYHDLTLGYLEKIDKSIYPNLHAAADEYEKNAKEYAEIVRHYGINHRSVKEIQKKLLNSHQALLSEYVKTASQNKSDTNIERDYRKYLNKEKMAPVIKQGVENVMNASALSRVILKRGGSSLGVSLLQGEIVGEKKDNRDGVRDEPPRRDPVDTKRDGDHSNLVQGSGDALTEIRKEVDALRGTSTQATDPERPKDKEQVQRSKESQEVSSEKGGGSEVTKLPRSLLKSDSSSSGGLSPEGRSAEGKRGVDIGEKNPYNSATKRVSESKDLDLVEYDPHKGIQPFKVQEEKITTPRSTSSILEDQKGDIRKSKDPVSPREVPDSHSKLEQSDHSKRSQIKGFDQNSESQSDPNTLKLKKKNQQINSEIQAIEASVTKNVEHIQDLDKEFQALKSTSDAIIIQSQELRGTRDPNKYYEIKEKLNQLYEDTSRASRQFNVLESELQQINVPAFKNPKGDQLQRIENIKNQLTRMKKDKARLVELSREIFDSISSVTVQFLPSPPRPRTEEEPTTQRGEKINSQKPLSIEFKSQQSLSNELYQSLQDELKKLQLQFSEYNNQGESSSEGLVQYYQDKITRINEHPELHAASNLKKEIEESESYKKINEIIGKLVENANELNQLADRSSALRPNELELYQKKKNLLSDLLQLKNENTSLSSKLKTVIKSIDEIYKENNAIILTLRDQSKRNVEQKIESVEREIENIIRFLKNPKLILSDCELQEQGQENKEKCLEKLKKHEKDLLYIKEIFEQPENKKLEQLNDDYNALAFQYQNYSEKVQQTLYRELGEKLKQINQIKSRLSQNPKEIRNVTDEFTKLKPQIIIREMNIEFPRIVKNSENLLSFVPLLQNKANELREIFPLGIESPKVEEEANLILTQLDIQKIDELVSLLQHIKVKRHELKSQIDNLKRLFTNKPIPPDIQYVLEIGSDQLKEMDSIEKKLSEEAEKAQSNRLFIVQYFQAHEEAKGLMKGLNAIISDTNNQISQSAAVIEFGGGAGDLANFKDKCNELNSRINIAINGLDRKNYDESNKQKQLDSLNEELLLLQGRYDRAIGNLEKDQEIKLGEFMTEILRKAERNPVIHAKIDIFENLVKQAREDKPENVKLYRQNLNQVKNLINDFRGKANITGESVAPLEEPPVENVKDDKLTDPNSESPSALQENPSEKCLTRAKEIRDLIRGLRDNKLNRARGINGPAEGPLIGIIENSIRELEPLCKDMTPAYFKNEYNLDNYSKNGLIDDLKRDFRLTEGRAMELKDAAIHIVLRARNVENESVQRLDRVLGPMPKISKNIEDWALKIIYGNRTPPIKSPRAQPVSAMDSGESCTNNSGVPLSRDQSKSIANILQVVDSQSMSNSKTKTRVKKKKSP